MKIYLAARMGRQKALRVFRRDLIALGHQVTSRWLDLPVLPDYASDPASSARVGVENLNDIHDSDILLCFTDTNPYYRGGRDTEFGYALCLARFDNHLHFPVIIGPRLSTFHYNPEVVAYATFTAFITNIHKFS